MASLSLAFLLLGTSALAQSPGKVDDTPVPDCSGPVPLYLRFPHTYFYHLQPDEALMTLLSKPFPKIDDGWFKERWLPLLVPSPLERDSGTNGTIKWVPRHVQSETEIASDDMFGWRHHPEDLPEISEKDKQESIQSGIQVHKAMKEHEALLFELHLYLNKGEPGHTLQKGFTYTTEEAKKKSVTGYIMDEATYKITDKYKINKVVDMGVIEEVKICAQLGNSPDFVTCDKDAKYRTLDGTCNNLFHPTFGASFTAFRRLLPQEYGDKVSSPKLAKDGSDLPSPRRVSLALKSFSQRMSSCFSVLQMSFGQYIDHEMTATPTAKGLNNTAITCCDERVLQDPSLSHPECFPIIIPADDPFYSVYGQTCMEFVRSIPAERCHFGPREQINQLTAFIDGSATYGSTKEQSDGLREMKGGLLKMQVTKEGHELLPVRHGDENGCNIPTQSNAGKFCFQAGDARVNEHLLLTLIHTLFAREHNRLARALAALHPSWDDETLFQEARRIVAAEIQHVTYNEFLSGVLGPLLVKALDLKPLRGDQFYTGYDDTVNAAIASEFSTAGFRAFGHSTIPTHFFEKDASGKYSIAKLNTVIFHPFHMYDPDMSHVLHGALSQSIGVVDQSFTSQITGKLFQKKKQLGLDLVALNLNRGRDHGLAGYVKVRQACGFPAIKSFDDLKGAVDTETVDLMRKLYKHVEDIDLFLGLVSEKNLPGALVGPTLACIMADQFTRAKKGDRFWYENAGQPGSFTAAQLTVLHNVSLARLICDNFPEVERVQRWPLQLVGAHNPALPCDSSCIPKFDLTPWA